MLSSSLDVLLKLSKTTSPKNLFDYDCVTLYIQDGNINNDYNNDYNLMTKARVKI